MDERKGQSMASSSSVSSWRVTYALRPFAGGGRNHPFLDGVLIIHHAKGRLLLLDRSEFVVDSRRLGERESVGFGGPVALPRHDVRSPPRPLPPSSLFGAEARHGRRQSGGDAIPKSASVAFRSAPFPSSIEELFYNAAPTRDPLRLSSPEPPRPRGGHIIDPGRWSSRGMLGASPGASMAEGPVAVAGLGLSPAATASMAAMDGDRHTCPASKHPPSIVNGGLRQEGPGKPSAYISSDGDAAAGFDLDLILGHYWDKSRVPPQPPSQASDTFGWWRGKVAGDLRSFAQVAASPPSMGDGGGRFGGGRGRNHPNRGRGRNVWQREDAAQTSSTNLRGSNSHSQQSNDRWEAAAWESEKRRQEAPAIAGGNTGTTQGAGASSLMAAGDPAPCLNCNLAGHYTARCPTIRCDRCKKLGHIAQICQTILLWECTPSMCGFQAPGRGFFYMPDPSSSKLVKERATSVVITIIEGNATCREIEQSFNMIFGDSWRCTARAIGPNQYTMRFPTPREVERAVCYGASMKLKTTDATVNLSPWTASVGAKAQLQKAWVKISNIPLDKRCEANVFYAGGLVGVSLDLEASTLHKPEYVKVLIGCRDIEMIPASAEGCLGDNFYDFYYEVDKIVVGGKPRDSSNVVVGNTGAPSSKRPRFEHSNIVTEENSDTQLMSSQTESVHQGRQDENVTITDVTVEVDTQESEDDSAGGELLIETITRGHEDALRQTDYLVQSPELSAGDNEEDTQEEQAIPRCSRRCPEDENTNIMDKVEKVARKRNLEGLQKAEDKSYLIEGVEKMTQAAAAVYSRRTTTSPN